MAGQWRRKTVCVPQKTSRAELQDAVDVAAQTLTEWMEAHPEFEVES